MTIDIEKSLLKQYGQYMSLKIFIDQSDNTTLPLMFTMKNFIPILLMRGSICMRSL